MSVELEFVQNFPCFSIMFCMFAGFISSAFKEKVARILNIAVLTINIILSAAVFVFTVNAGKAYVYVMGRFPAPWGNELRIGILETGLALFFCVIMLLSLLGGRHKLMQEVEEGKQGLYYVLSDLMLSSLLALLYTNDLFTAYVFVEINTISACGLIMIRQNGRTIEAAVRYMIMSLLGSGLFLVGICMLYDLTGHLLMSNIKIEIAHMVAEGSYRPPLLVTIAIMSVGLAIKSALFPFHAWLPDAYGYSTVSSAAILSSLVSKGYIFLMFKIIYRVIGFDVFHDSKIVNILFIFALMGMVFGSLSAIKENDVRRMIAFSSVAQVGYIYMGVGMGTHAGMVAAVFHVISHVATKSLLFIAAIGLTDVSGGSRKFIELTGSGYRNKCAGAAFSVGSLSMVGVPMFSGFISKLLFSQAAVQNTVKMLPILIVLGISTILNAVYFMKTVIRIYTPVNNREYSTVTWRDNKVYAAVLFCFVVLNILLGVCSQPIVDLIESGLMMFA